LGRVNDKLQTNDDCDSGKKGLVRVESSSDDDIVHETVKEMHEILVKVSPFNPFRTDKTGNKRRLRSVPSIVKRVNSTDANADEQLLTELRKGNGVDKEVHNGSDHETSSSSETLAQSGHRTSSKSKGRGKVDQSLSLVKQVIGSKITGDGLVVKKRQVLGTQAASSTRNFKVSKNALLVNKNLLKGQKLLRHFPVFGSLHVEVQRRIH
jgi:hypothetical protein